MRAPGCRCSRSPPATLGCWCWDGSGRGPVPRGHGPARAPPRGPGELPRRRRSHSVAHHDRRPWRLRRSRRRRPVRRGGRLRLRDRVARHHLVVVHSDSGPVRKVVQDDGVTWATTAQLTVAETWPAGASATPTSRSPGWHGRSATDALVGASPHAGLIVVGAHAGGLPHDPVTRRGWPPRPARSRVVKHDDLRRAAPGTQRGRRRRRPDV